MQRLRLETTSDPVHFAPVRRKVEALGASAGFDEQSVGEIGLCVNEALANITRHAYGNARDKPIVLEAEVENGQLEIKIRDWGTGRDPSGLACQHDPLTPGGLGMVCLRQLMDDLTFVPQPDGMLLAMRKGIKQGSR